MEVEPRQAGDAVVLYDGVCAMCNAIVRFVLRRDPDGHFRFVALQSESARQLLQRHGRVANDLDTMYLMTGYGGGDERLLEKSSAAIETLRRLGGLWRAAVLLRIVPAPIRDFAYALIVRNRYRLFGRYDYCPLTPPQWRARFLTDEERPAA